MRNDQVAVIDERTGAKLREATSDETLVYWRAQRDPRFPVVARVGGSVLLWISRSERI